jgi:hypothetical protein
MWFFVRLSPTIRLASAISAILSKICEEAFRPVFFGVRRLAGEMGVVKIENVSTDGTTMKASASRHRAISYKHMDT